MLKIIRCFLFLGFIFTSAVALARSEAPNKATKTPARFNLKVGPALGVLNSNTGWGASATLQTQILPELPLYAGLETGFLYWGSSNTSGPFTVSSSMTSLPILPMVVYRFSNDSSRIIPYIGVAAGVSITSQSGSFGMGSLSNSGSSTNIYFEGLFKAGIEYGAFYFEPKLGFLKNDLIFLPTVGHVFFF